MLTAFLPTVPTPPPPKPPRARLQPFPLANTRAALARWQPPDCLRPCSRSAALPARGLYASAARGSGPSNAPTRAAYARPLPRRACSLTALVAAALRAAPFLPSPPPPPRRPPPTPRRPAALESRHPRVNDGGVTADGGDGSKNGYKYKGVVRPWLPSDSD